jgi:hypothetical protein
MNLTEKEVKVLKAIDESEYGDGLLDDVWSFTIADNSDLIPASIGGIVGSLVKKGLVVGDTSYDDDYLGMTEAGVEAYVNAVGIENVNKWFTLSNGLSNES